MAELLTILTLTIVPKNMTTLIGHNLTNGEFRCQCDRSSCHYTLISPELVAAWDELRSIMNTPLHVNSGYRCQEHNAEVKGVDKSSHTTGHAIDISFKGFSHGKKLQLINEARKVFSYVKIYPHMNFIHCQING